MGNLRPLVHSFGESNRTLQMLGMHQFLVQLVDITAVVSPTNIMKLYLEAKYG